MVSVWVRTHTGSKQEEAVISIREKKTKLVPLIWSDRNPDQSNEHFDDHIHKDETGQLVYWLPSKTGVHTWQWGWGVETSVVNCPDVWMSA